MENIVIIAIFWPPVAVLIKHGFGQDFWKNLLFTLMGFYPGVIHALRLVNPKAMEESI
ncbi:MAG: YqaE/Pmp3 family membrane protein [Sedimentisphaerales bacterium]|nr:YqaE/Pmp3 family membrane protein [Sedimentisphaerales bacterium]